MAAPNSPVQINPVQLTKPQMDEYVSLFNEQPGGASPIIAQAITGEVAVDYPDLISYDGLKQGTAPLFDQLPAFSNLNPAERKLSDDQIISLFAVGPEGDPIAEGTFAGGFFRDLMPQGFSMAGAYAGAKLGYKLQQPIPPVGPGAVALKFGIPLVTTVVGAFGGYETGEALTEGLFGDEKPLLPGTTAAYEAGKTAAGALAWMPMPFMISKNISFGGAQYLDNLAELRTMTTRVGPPTAVESTVLSQTAPGVLKAAAKEKGPRTTRIISGIERLLSRSSEAAQKSPIATGVTEALVGTGAVGGAYLAEDVAPGEVGTRIGAEVAGGFTPTLLGATLMTKLPGLLPVFKSLQTSVREKGVKGMFEPLKTARQQTATQRIIEILEAEGEDVETIIERLASTEMSSLLVDEAGKPIPLTAGAKAGSPALLAIEAALEQTGSGLGKERAASNKKAMDAIRNVIAALSQNGDPQALKIAADMAEEVFQAGLITRMDRATGRVLEAAERVAGDGAGLSNMELSQKLADVLQTQLNQARGRERSLWQAVPDLEITEFKDAEGAVLDAPNFITKWRELMPRTQEAAEEVNRALAPIARFVDRKAQELGMSGMAGSRPLPEETAAQKALDKLGGTYYGDRATKLFTDNNITLDMVPQDDTIIKLLRTEAAAPGTKAYKDAMSRTADLLTKRMRLATETATDVAEDAVGAPLTVNEAQEMRSLALSLGRQYQASGDLNNARIALGFADALLDDMNSLPDGANVAYDMARAYSRSLNDTFTRAFAGELVDKTRKGSERLAPELLANRLFQGGDDPTYLRVRQLEAVGNFAKQQGFEGADEAASTIKGTTEMILRNARARAFDPETGQVNTRRLQQWMTQNKELLDAFPAIRADLENAQTANVLLGERLRVNKGREQELKDQVTFRNLLSSKIESPTTVISQALSRSNRRPMQSINNLLKTANSAPENLREQARSGLKSSILEWAMTSGGGTSRTFSPRELYDRLFTKIPNADTDISLVSWMTKNDVMSEQEVKQLRTWITEMVKLEASQATGEIGELVERTGPILDFYLRITGSALGTKAQSVMTGGQSGPGALVAAGAGSKALRRVFEDVPEALKSDVMTELMRNPELLAVMMRKPKNEREKLRLAERLGNMLIDLGFKPVRRTAPAVTRELGPEEEYELPVTEPQASVQQPRPNLMAQRFARSQPTVIQPRPPMRAPTPVAQAPMPAPAPQQGGANPQQRQQLAAMFPNDPILGAAGGLGSLFG
jgi:hypothetical protein